MSTRINLGQLVPFYCAGPNPRGIFSKAWAVATIVRNRLAAANADGHGNRAQRRVEAARARLEAEADAAPTEWFDERLLTESDVGALAGRLDGRRVPSVNFHE